MPNLRESVQSAELFLLFVTSLDSSME